MSNAIILSGDTSVLHRAAAAIHRVRHECFSWLI